MIEIPSLASWLVKNFVDMIPAKIVREYERGVLFRKGVAVRHDLKAGKVHWYRPFLDKIELVDAVEQVDVLEAQSLTTKDGVSVVARFNLKYSIWSAWRIWTKVHNPYESLYAMVQGYIAAYAADANWKDLKHDPDTVTKAILAIVAPVVKPWGFSLHDISATELVEAKHFRVFGEAKGVIPLNTTATQ